MDECGMKIGFRLIHGEKKENRIYYGMHQQVLEQGSAFNPTDRQCPDTSQEHIFYLKIQSPIL
jgi:hypothetical protein